MVKIARVAGWVVTVILFLFIAGLAFIHYSPGYSFSMVRSGSMSPTINMGDAIITTPAASKVKPGLIVTYLHDGELITHRVLSVNGDILATKGDAMEHPDPWPVQITDVKGMFLFRIPYIGFVANFVRTRVGWFAAIIVPTTVILGLIIKDILKEAFKDEKKAANRGEVKTIVERNETKNPAG